MGSVQRATGSARFESKAVFLNYSIIKSHAPTEEKPQNEKEEFYEDLEAVYRHCPKNDIKIIMGDMNAKVRQEPIFSLTIGRNTFHKKSNDNGLRLINLAALLNMASTCFQNRNIHKAALVSPDGSTNQIDHLLIETRHGSDILDCHRYRGANVDLDHYLVIAKLRARISYKEEERREAMQI